MEPHSPIREALTFDDVLLVPAASEVLPSQVDTRTKLTKTVELGIPLISAAMDTVTESRLAIAMAQLGGLGIVHKNFDPARQAQEVRSVKKFWNVMYSTRPSRSISARIDGCASSAFISEPKAKTEAERV